jgi:hypothetical protein
MKTFTISSLFLWFALCAPVGAYASDGVPHKHHVHHPVVYLQMTPKAAALVPAPKAVDDDSDGLTRNIDECNRGCIDN